MKSEQMYIKKPVVKLTGKETFKNTGTKKFSILEFWQYGFSNLNSNVMRGVLAEFIVESALKNNMEIETRSPWGNYDVFYLGKKIEVKCSAYIQDWDQNKLTTGNTRRGRTRSSGRRSRGTSCAGPGTPAWPGRPCTGRRPRRGRDCSLRVTSEEIRAGTVARLGGQHA
jgi:hypothetical protein